jgi:hypothetical protein
MVNISNEDAVNKEEEVVVVNKKFTFDDSGDYIKKISPVNPIEDFRAMMNNKKVDLV